MHKYTENTTIKHPWDFNDSKTSKNGGGVDKPLTSEFKIFE